MYLRNYLATNMTVLMLDFSTASNNANNRADKYQIRHLFLSQKSKTNIAMESRRLCVAIFFPIGTPFSFSQHCKWLPLQTWAQNYGKVWEDLQPTVIDLTKSSSYGADEVMFFFRTSRQCERYRRTDPLTKTTISATCSGMGSKRGTSITEN